MVDNKFYYKLIINDHKYWCFLKKKFKFYEGKMILDFFKICYSQIKLLSLGMQTTTMDLLLLLSWKMTSRAAGSCVCRLFQMGAGHSNLELLHSSEGPNAVFWKGNFWRQMWFPGSVWAGIMLCRTYIVLKTKENHPLVLECLLE